MTPYYDHAGITIYHGDCREVLPNLIVDHVITVPPFRTLGLAPWESQSGPGVYAL